MEKEKAERTVVHVELLCDNSHHYLVAWLPSTKNSRKRRLVLAMAACVTMGFQQKSHTKINSALSGKGC